MMVANKRPDRVPLIVGVTGHRDLVDDELAVIESQVRTFFDDLRHKYPDVPLLLLTSLATGADTLVAEIAIDIGCDVTNVLPMPLNLYSQDFEGEARTHFEALWAKNDTLELPLLGSDGGEAVAVHGPARNLQYEQLGAFLAAHSHILLALWDGKFNQAVGGTGHVIDFHRRDVTALADEEQVRSQLDIADDESDLIYHVVCSRMSAGAPATGLTPGSACWLTRDDVEPRIAELPSRYHKVFETMSQFNRDLGLIAEIAEDALFTLEPEQTTPAAEQACAAIQWLYGRSDALASLYQERMLWALRATLGAALLAGMSFIMYADFADQRGMIWGYLVFVGASIASYLLAQRFDWQRRHLDYRVLAEGLRVQYYWTLAGVEMSNPSRYSHDRFFQGRDLQLGWIRNVMRFTGIQADAGFVPGELELAAAINGWVGDDSSGQLGYYQVKADDKLVRHRATQRITSACLMLGVAAAAVLAVGGAILDTLLSNWLVALMGLLPIVAAVRQNYAHRLAERELVAQYAHMREVFRSAHRLLQGTDQTAAQQVVLRDLGEAALNENAQWILRQRERPLPGGDAMS